MASNSNNNNNNNTNAIDQVISPATPRVLSRSIIPTITSGLDASDVLECYALVRKVPLHGIANSTLHIQKAALGFRYRPQGGAGSSAAAAVVRNPVEITLEYGPQRVGGIMDAMPLVQIEGAGTSAAFLSWDNVGRVYYTTKIVSEHYLSSYYMASMTGTVLGKMLNKAVEYAEQRRRYQPFAVFTAAAGGGGATGGGDNNNNNNNNNNNIQRTLKSASSQDFTSYIWKELAGLGVEIEPILSPPIYEARLWTSGVVEKVIPEGQVAQDAAMFYYRLYECMTAIATNDYSEFTPTTQPSISLSPTVQQPTASNAPTTEISTANNNNSTDTNSTATTGNNTMTNGDNGQDQIDNVNNTKADSDPMKDDDDDDDDSNRRRYQMRRRLEDADDDDDDVVVEQYTTTTTPKNVSDPGFAGGGGGDDASQTTVEGDETAEDDFYRNGDDFVDDPIVEDDDGDGDDDKDGNNTDNDVETSHSEMPTSSPSLSTPPTTSMKPTVQPKVNPDVNAKTAKNAADEANKAADEAKNAAVTDKDNTVADAAKAAAVAAEEAAAATTKAAAQAARDAILSGDGDSMVSIITTSCLTNPMYGIADVSEDGNLTAQAYLYRDGSLYWHLELVPPFFTVEKVDRPLPRAADLSNDGNGVEFLDWTLVIIVLGMVLVGFVMIVQQMNIKIHHRLYYFQRWFFNPTKYDYEGDMFVTDTVEAGKDGVPISMGGTRTIATSSAQYRDSPSSSYHSSDSSDSTSSDHDGGGGGTADGDVDGDGLELCEFPSRGRQRGHRATLSRTGSDPALEFNRSRSSSHEDDASTIPKRLMRNPDLVDLPFLTSSSKVATPVGLAMNGKKANGKKAKVHANGGLDSPL
eukprot:scaffold1469_cov119-Cylindrotheca_fusiformis.AAC.11